MGSHGPKPGTPSPLKGRKLGKRPPRSKEWCENISRSHGGKWIAPGIKKKRKIICKNCSTDFYVDDKSTFPTYCSKKCFKEACSKRPIWSTGKHVGSTEAQKRASDARIGGPRYPAKTQFVAELGHEVRSGLEKQVFLLLKENSISYAYEPEYCKLVSAMPGIKGVWIDSHIDGTNIWLECKGPKKFKELRDDGNFIKGSFLDDATKEKLSKYRQQYPSRKLWILTYKNMVDNFPVNCYDRLFIVEDLNELVTEILWQKLAQHLKRDLQGVKI